MALILVSVALSFGLYVGAVELVEFVPAATAPSEYRVSRAPPAPEARSADTNPVWIAATAKYHYDPKLLQVRPRNDLKEAEFRRRQQAAKHAARLKEAKARRGLREARQASAFAPEPSRPDFTMFPFVR